MKMISFFMLERRIGRYNFIHMSKAQPDENKLITQLYIQHKIHIFRQVSAAFYGQGAILSKGRRLRQRSPVTIKLNWIFRHLFLLPQEGLGRLKKLKGILIILGPSCLAGAHETVPLSWKWIWKNLMGLKASALRWNQIEGKMWASCDRQMVCP